MRNNLVWRVMGRHGHDGSWLCAQQSRLVSALSKKIIFQRQLADHHVQCARSAGAPASATTKDNGKATNIIANSAAIHGGEVAV